MSEALLDSISVVSPCDTGANWLEDFDGTAQEAWDACPRGEWLIWLMEEAQLFGTAPKMKRLISCLLDIALLARSKWPEALKPTLDMRVVELRAALVGGKLSAYPAEDYLQQLEVQLGTLKGREYWSVTALSNVLDRLTSDMNGYDVSCAVESALVDTEAKSQAKTDKSRNFVRKQTADVVRAYFPKPPARI